MPRWLILVIAVVGVSAAAGVEALYSHRGGDSEEIRAAAARLEGVPASFGDWTSTDAPLDPKQLRIAEAAGHVSRQYTNRKTGSSVSVLLLCGASGPIGAHTPEICYAGNGYEKSSNPKKLTLALPDQGVATYWSAHFAKKSAFEPPLRVCWMWGAGGEWIASENPRGEFALRGALYKLYVVRVEPRTATTSAASNAPDPIQEFLTDFLPEVKKALAPPAGAA
jgi:hypothetical protein